jgi:hypothetical protein
MRSKQVIAGRGRRDDKIKQMYKVSWLKIAGLVAAIWLIIFGSVDNLWRTIRFGLEKLNQ